METYTWYNLYVIGFAAFGSLFAGYGLSVIVPTVGQPTWYSSLHLAAVATAPNYSHTTTIIGAANGILFGFGFFGTFASGWAGEKYGRLNGFRIAAVVGIIGAVIQTAAVNQAMYLVARAITGFATGHTLAAMPTYYSEVAPPHSRGLMAGAHGVFVNGGYFMTGWIGVGTFFAKTSFGWRFPNAVLALWGLCLIGGTFLVPESPRWLVSQGRREEALKVLCRLHHDPNDPEDQFAHRELSLIQHQQDIDVAAFNQDGRWQLFTKPTYRKRFYLAMLLMMGGQNVGTLVINNFNVLLYRSLGLSDSASLVVSATWNTVALIFNGVGASISDRLGRRKALLIGFACCTSVFTISTGLIAKYSETPTKPLATAATVFLFLYAVFYAGFIDPNQFVVSAEVFPSHLRSQASSLAISGIFLVDCLWLELQPTAMATIGWKYYIIFLGLGLIHTIHLYFYLPETSGLALEEIDALFGKEPVGHVTDDNLLDLVTVRVDKGKTED